MDVDVTSAQCGPATDDTPPSVAYLTAMPPEILAKIIAAIERPSDLWALRCASMLFVSVSPADLAVRWGAQRMHRLLASGAPVEIIIAAIALRARPLSISAIVDAVNGKRFDVIALTAGGCEQQDSDDGVPPPVITHANNRSIGNSTVEATVLAASHGLTAIVRHLIRTSRTARKELRYGDRLAYTAAVAQCLDTLIYAHDMQVYDNPHCTCTSRVGDAAWKSARPDMIEWMAETGCQGFVSFTADRAAYAIRKGHTDMLRFMEAHDLRTVCRDNEREIGHAVYRAARKGALDVLTMVAQLDLCPTITPVLVGATVHGDDSVMRWTLDGAGPCIARWGEPDRLAVRAAAASAVTVDEVKTLDLLVTRYAKDVDIGLLMWCAITNDSIEAVKWLETRLIVPFDWNGALPFVVCTQAARVLRHAVEHHRVSIGALTVAIGSSDQGGPMLDLFCSACTHEQLQQAVDIMGAVSFRNYVPAVQGIRKRVPTICVAHVVASEAHAHAASPVAQNHETVTACECPRCLSLRADTATTAPTEAAVQEPPRKRARLDGVAESANADDHPLLPGDAPPALDD
ncbi:hypothetical protein pkur_cds_725 [Pandoravirus kuranda]|uniref:Uncharacterized protein n=1 Tax=Pandoravirus kuranda TaxID=3019033 RepID=A0AA95EEC1_9VIRU|nr:hypothetical protein pkur_cds_725 [Pandoravirus kuranda]